MQKASPLLRREREWHFLFSGFERRKRNFEKNLKFREEKRNLKFLIPVSRREICRKVLLFREEKEKSAKRFSSFEKRKRNGYSFLKFLEEIAVCPILHTSSNTGERLALFGQKYRQNSSFCDSDIFLCNRNREEISEIGKSKIFISNRSYF